MALSIVFNGVVYSIPETGDESWGESLTSYFTAIPQGALQKTGGTFTLTADVNFGANFGLLAKYFETRSTNPSTAGLFRLAVSDTIGWRNNANDGNLLLAVDGSDQLIFNGGTIIPGGITALTGDVTATGPGSVVATIATHAVTNAQFRQSAALSVVGNATNSLANVADITAGIDGQVLGRSGTSLAFGLIINANVDPSAQINYSKLALTNSIVNADISSSAAIAYSKLALTGSIVNGDINASAAIAYSKLNLSGSIVNTDINASAAIDYSKLNLSGSIVNADINASAAIAYSKLSLSGSIVNADISSSAAIANSKLATMVTGTVKGNISGSTATPSDVSTVSASTASTVMLRDTNANVSVNNIANNYATTATAAGTTTLTVASAKNQFFTGSTTQNVALPDATTLTQTGFQFYIVNLSSGVVTIKDNGSNTVQALPASSWAWVTAKSISSSNGSWDVQFGTNNSGGGTVTSVAMTVPTALFATSPVSGSPVTTSGTLAPTLATQSARTFFQGPAAGSAATPTFTALKAPTFQKFTASPTGATNYAFTITAGNTASVGAIYTNNGQSFTLIAPLLVGDTILYCSGTGTPSASGTLTYSSGTHTGGNITFSAFLGAYVLPTSTTPLYLRVRMIGGGGGGAGSSSSANDAGNGGTGGTTTFGTSLLSCVGGSPGTKGGTIGGLGGTASLGAAIGSAWSGGQGGGGSNAPGTAVYLPGGYGASSPFAGGTGGGYNNAIGSASPANTGIGGAGAAGPGLAGAFAGAGGGAGGYLHAYLSATNYSWAVGAAGTAGSAGTSGGVGLAGSAGYIEVTEFYQ